MTKPFPSPYGDYGSYRKRHHFHVLRLQFRFRPLTGIMVLIVRRYGRFRPHQDAVSVPLRGLWFLSLPPVQGFTGISERFPSPYGDYGSYRDDVRDELYCRMMTFPSPYGDYGSYRQGLTADEIEMIVVSVPLRGLWFLSSS